MEKTFSRSNEAIENYVNETFHPEDQVLRDIRQAAVDAAMPDIHVGTMDGLHLEVLVRAIGARNIVEIGTLAGYSGTCMARGLPADGKLYTFEFEPKHAEVARASFKRADVADKVEIFVGPALDNLDRIKDHGPFDLVFIDADKASYPAYFEWAITNLKRGGAILADNTFAGGGVAELATNPSPRARTLDEYNRQAANDPRLRSTILPTSDGLTFSVKI